MCLFVSRGTGVREWASSRRKSIWSDSFVVFSKTKNKDMLTTEKMRGLITYADKEDPTQSFVMNTKMPTGSVASFMSACKLVNTIRLGECKLTDQEIKREQAD